MAETTSAGGEQNCQDSMDNFKDPLGAKDPLSPSIDGESDEIDFESPTTAKQLDLAISEALKENANKLTSLTLLDDDESETKDLFVVVDNPEKHAATMESYITFRVSTKTSRPEYDAAEYQVRRRYNDFLWLKQRLEESEQTHIVPPLPEKHSLKRLDRFNQDFVKTRMAALQVFMSRIVDHPVLSFNKHFQTFLTAKQWEFQAAKKEGSGFMSRMADSFHNMSASYMMKNRPPEYTLMNEYIHTLAEKLGVLDRISQRVSKEQYDYLSDLNEWGPIFTLWSNSEGSLSPALAATAKAVEKSYLALQDLVDATDNKFSQPLKEYILYAESVKAVLRRRDAIQMEYEMTLEELNRKKDERDQVQIAEGSSLSIGSLLGKSPEDVKQQRVDKLAHNIEELNNQVESLNDKSECANADLKADMDRWHKTKRRDFKNLFMDTADRQIAYYEKCLQAWEEAVTIIHRTEQQFESENTTLSDE